MYPINNNMTPGERRIAWVLAGVFSARMLGLFMVLPVFSLYAEQLTHYTASLAGWAIGVYALTQALLQIPLGRWSDRVGRRPIIIGGLLVFALGSVIAALATDIYGVILGRALQGAGAISGAVMALAADLTREEHRLKVMAVIGGSIGLSFAVAIVLGPVLQGWFGVPGIFWLTMVLALAALGLVIAKIPRTSQTVFHRDTEVEWSWVKRVLADGQLLRLDIGVFLLHLVMTASFFSLPLLLAKQHQFDVSAHWQVYLPTMLVAIAVVLPFIFLGERRRLLKQVVIAAWIVLILASLGLWLGYTGWWTMVVLIGIFFTGFNALEASLPSLVAKFAPTAHRGSAMGVFSTAQFLGAFIGAVGAGWIVTHFEPATVFLANALLLCLWLAAIVTLRQPLYYSTQLLQIGRCDASTAEALAVRLQAIPGVAEAIVIGEDGVAYLKVDHKALDKSALYAYSLPPNHKLDAN